MNKHHMKTPSQIKKLEDHFLINQSYNKNSNAVKKLSSETGLSLNQIKDWIDNKRRRDKNKGKLKKTF